MLEEDSARRGTIVPSPPRYRPPRAARTNGGATAAPSSSLSLGGRADLVFEGGVDNGGCGSIYLGPQEAASESAKPHLRKAKVGGIVNCTNRVPNCFEATVAKKNEGGGGNDRYNAKYCTVAVNDEDSADIYTYLWGATSFIHAVLSSSSVSGDICNDNSNSVLVHCQMGVSRSSTVVLAYLIRFQNMTRESAFEHVRSRRPKIRPNRGFWIQLERFESEVNASRRRERGRDTQEEEEADGSNCFDNETSVSSRGSSDDTANIIDTNWAERSCALYSTCRSIPDLMYHPNNEGNLMVVLPHKHNNNNNNNNLRAGDDDNKSALESHCYRVLCVCLDFVWGRGVLQTDLEWLLFLCDRLPSPLPAAGAGNIDKVGQDKEEEEEEEAITLETTDSINAILLLDGRRIVRTILRDKNSEFWEQWSGEIYELQIERVLEALKQRPPPDAATTTTTTTTTRWMND